jgi:antitoxin VapB
MNEFETKQSHMHALLVKHQLDALLLNRVSSFAWATCGVGDSHINTASSNGVASLLITRDARYLITNNIEAPRFEREHQLAAQGWEFSVTPWYRANALDELARGKKFGADEAFAGATDLSAEVSNLRANLLPEEGERFRALGKLCAGAMDAAIRAVNPGLSEFEIAALLAQETQARGVEPIVTLIATDERIFNFRHPIPVAKNLEKYAMLVLCGRKWGLVCSLTRLAHFGKLPDELRAKENACAAIDAAMIAATRPNKTLGEIFQRTTEAYKNAGFADEWQLHHQGGLAGYEPREIVATPSSAATVSIGQAFAWNPSITGVKSEDTILVGENGNEILTAIPNWETVRIEIDGQAIARPRILERG